MTVSVLSFCYNYVFVLSSSLTNHCYNLDNYFIFSCFLSERKRSCKISFGKTVKKISAMPKSIVLLLFLIIHSHVARAVRFKNACFEAPTSDSGFNDFWNCMPPMALCANKGDACHCADNLPQAQSLANPHAKVRMIEGVCVAPKKCQCQTTHQANSQIVNFAKFSAG